MQKKAWGKIRCPRLHSWTAGKVLRSIKKHNCWWTFIIIDNMLLPSSSFGSRSINTIESKALGFIRIIVGHNKKGVVFAVVVGKVMKYPESTPIRLREFWNWLRKIGPTSFIQPTGIVWSRPESPGFVQIRMHPESSRVLGGGVDQSWGCPKSAGGDQCIFLWSGISSPTPTSVDCVRFKTIFFVRKACLRSARAK